MAKDGLLGKDLSITWMRVGGSPFKLETEKFDEEQKTDEKTKHPLGEPHEHTRVILKGWEISVEGEVTDPTIDDLIAEIEASYRGDGTPYPQLEVHTTEIYSDGTVRKWKFSSVGGVRISGFKKTGDKGDEARKYSFKISAQRRDKV